MVWRGSANRLTNAPRRPEGAIDDVARNATEYADMIEALMTASEDGGIGKTGARATV